MSSSDLAATLSTDKQELTDFRPVTYFGHISFGQISFSQISFGHPSLGTQAIFIIHIYTFVSSPTCSPPHTLTIQFISVTVYRWSLSLLLHSVGEGVSCVLIFIIHIAHVSDISIY